MNRTMAKWILRRGAGWAAWAGFSLMCGCSPAPLSTNDGGGTRVGNPVVVGTIAGPDGAAAGNVRVSLIPEAYNPLTDTLSRRFSSDTTDSLGSFSITAPDSGWYNVEARSILDVACLIRFKVKTVRDSVLVLPIDTLRRPGAIKVALPAGSDSVGGYFYVPGTFISAWIDGACDTVSLDSVPTGILPVLYYARRNVAGEKTIRYDIPVKPDETTMVKNPEWSRSRRIVLNTSASGASVSGDVYDFPALIRLNSGNFDFKQVRNDGGDIMFTGGDNKTIPFEIERWDAAARKAEIWVKVDTVHGNDSDQSITVYWGNAAAANASNGAAVFDTASGFQGVWHLGDAANDFIHDATANRYNGVSPDTALPLATEGVIGNCRQFDGQKDFITMPNTAEGKLNFPQDGYYTVSSWVFIDTFGAKPQLIVSKGYEQYFLWASNYPTESPFWEFDEFNESTNWEWTRSPATNGQWMLITGVRQGKNQFLYCNGGLVDSVKDAQPWGISRDTSNDLSIGGFLERIYDPADEGYCFLRGSIDEVRIISTAQSPDWVRLSYMNQRPDDKLVNFK